MIRTRVSLTSQPDLRQPSNSFEKGFCPSTRIGFHQRPVKCTAYKWTTLSFPGLSDIQSSSTINPTYYTASPRTLLPECESENLIGSCLRRKGGTPPLRNKNWPQIFLGLKNTVFSQPQTWLAAVWGGNPTIPTFQVIRRWHRLPAALCGSWNGELAFNVFGTFAHLRPF